METRNGGDDGTREHVETREHENVCGDERAREHMETKKPRKCGAMGTQERVETREHENMWLEKIPAGNQNKT